MMLVLTRPFLNSELHCSLDDPSHPWVLKWVPLHVGGRGQVSGDVQQRTVPKVQPASAAAAKSLRSLHETHPQLPLCLE